MKSKQTSPSPNLSPLITNIYQLILSLLFIIINIPNPTSAASNIAFDNTNAYPPPLQNHVIYPPFVGISLEWQSGNPPWMVPVSVPGLKSDKVNEIVMRLFRNLVGDGKYPLYVRVGGNSHPNINLNEAIKFISEGILHGNRNDNFTTIIPPSIIIGFELGNEPEDFAGLCRDKSYNASNEYPTEWINMANGIESHLQSTNNMNQLAASKIFMGPATNANLKTSPFGMYIGNETIVSKLNTITLHKYGLSNCKSQTNSPYQLLNATMTSNYTFLNPSIYENTLAKVPFILGETSSVACGGVMGVSDVFASSLWVLDHLGYALWNGMSRALIHRGVYSVSTGSFRNGVAEVGSYAAVVVDRESGMLVNVRPIYYGILGFERLVEWVASSGGGGDVGGGVRIVMGRSDNPMDEIGLVKYWGMAGVSGNGAAGGGGDGGASSVHVDDASGTDGSGAEAKKSTQGRGGILVINMGNASAEATFNIPTGVVDTGSARVESLFVTAFNESASPTTTTVANFSSSPAAAPISASARTGITLAGQTFDGTCDGRPTSSYISSVITASKVDGRYTVMVPAMSALLVYLGPGNEVPLFDTSLSVSGCAALIKSGGGAGKKTNVSSAGSGGKDGPGSRVGVATTHLSSDGGGGFHKR
ncbi:hypothetical protein HDU76_001424, partial [Blyttiomyces sp. JEL0837]